MVGDLTMDSAPTVGNLIIDKVKSPIIPTYSRTVEVGHAIDKCITGFDIPAIAAVLSGSAWMSFLSMRCPKNFMLIRLNSHFSGFRVTPAD